VPTPERALFGAWLVWCVLWWVAALWRDRAVKSPPARHQILYRVLAATGALLTAGVFRHDIGREIVLWRTPAAAAWVLVAAAIAGLSFTWWARIHLGRLWSSSVGRKADHHVIDTGPYAIVRHPIYTGITLAAMATAAMRGTALAWLGVALMTAGWYIKARMEEVFLREQLGADAYGRYATRVPMLVPFLPRSR
jgi:protein-S-isoprenylcysteine O-methyltransferase Ste14